MVSDFGFILSFFYYPYIYQLTLDSRLKQYFVFDKHLEYYYCSASFKLINHFKGSCQNQTIVDFTISLDICDWLHNRNSYPSVQKAIKFILLQLKAIKYVFWHIS